MVAMTRGVYCPPATWIATSKDPNVNTRKDSDSVTIVSSPERAPDNENPNSAFTRLMCPASTSQSPAAPVSRTITCSTTIAKKGTTQSEELT